MAISVAGGVRPGKIIEIEHRLYQQLIVGKAKAHSSQFDELDADLEADAHKLDIEREAIAARLAQQMQTRAAFEAISKQLSDTVSQNIAHQLASPERVLERSGINETPILLLELLLAKNLDINRLRPLIASLGWLCRDLTNMVNSPAFCARRPHSSDIQVTDIKLVINYIGIENLRTIVPYFCLRNLLPRDSAKLLWTTRKLWRYSISTAIAANALSQLHDSDTALAYSAALLEQLGTSVVLGLSARAFEKTWGEWIREASNSRDKEIYDAVAATEFPAQLVFEHVLQHGHKLNWQLLDALKFEQSPLTLLLKELDQTLSYADLSFHAALVARASCYAKVMLLEEMRQLDPQEKRLMFDYYELSEQEVLRLKAQNYRKLDLF